MYVCMYCTIPYTCFLQGVYNTVQVRRDERCVIELVMDAACDADSIDTDTFDIGPNARFSSTCSLCDSYNTSHCIVQYHRYKCQPPAMVSRSIWFCIVELRDMTAIICAEHHY